MRLDLRQYGSKDRLADSGNVFLVVSEIVPRGQGLRLAKERKIIIKSA